MSNYSERQWNLNEEDGSPVSTVVLVSCTKQKAEETCAAKYLYSPSTYFRKQAAYARAVGDAWYILSAKHHVLQPDESVSPYDQQMADRDCDAWADETTAQLVSRLGDDVETIIFTAGKEYAAPLASRLADRLGVDIQQPFTGMRIGTRMAAMEEVV